jgi:protein involved in ribonucleotide reduction
VEKTPVYYYSSTSNLTGRFAQHLAEATGRAVHNLADASVRRAEASGPWVLLTPSYKAGNADEVTLPAGVRSFLRSPSNRRRMLGIIGSGNRNFGVYYQAAARELAVRSGRPVLFEFELAGTPEDVIHCAQILDELDAALAASHPGVSDPEPGLPRDGILKQ